MELASWVKCEACEMQANKIGLFSFANLVNIDQMKRNIK